MLPKAKYLCVMLRFLIGPTAVGKTALSLAWAQANNAEILCADAPLVYRGMDIGTAKPTKEEQKQVLHHGIDVAEPQERFSVAEYINLAQKVVADVEKRGKNLLIVGGSGFYLRSFLEPVTDGIEISAEVVETVANIFEKKGLEGMLSELVRVGGESLTGLDTKNPRRVMKALERCLASGKSYQEVLQTYKDQPLPYPNYQKRMIQLWRAKEDLEARIRQRAKAMLEAGLMNEVQNLRATGFEKNPSAASVIGYRETLQFLDGTLSYTQLQEAIVQNTLQLVRKQRTFFKQLPTDETVVLNSEESPSAEILF